MVSRRWVEGYLARHGVAGPWTLDLGDAPLAGAIVVPAFAEEENLAALVASLSADPTLPGARLAVLVVVNHRVDATDADKENSRRSLEFLRRVEPKVPFPLFAVDAVSPGLELPARDGGVGLARKIGHDLFLAGFEGVGPDALLVSLDADTLVEPGYAAAVTRHFSSSDAGGAVIPFAHQVSPDERENRAIVRYELFLRCYVAGLAFAGSPYAFQTVGSAMACRASAYARAGGMNRRRAGEDFYFVQALAKTGGVRSLSGTCVHPSPRRSHRVPFGTGRAVGALLDGEEGAVLFHQPSAFRLLGRWLTLSRAACLTGDPELPDAAARVSTHLAEYLEAQGFRSAWARLREQNRTPERLERAFHGWFDAFRTMKLLHALADGPLPRGEPEEVLPRWPEVWGPESLDQEGRLAFLRARSGV